MPLEWTKATASTSSSMKRRTCSVSRGPWLLWLVSYRSPRGQNSSTRYTWASVSNESTRLTMLGCRPRRLWSTSSSDLSSMAKSRPASVAADFLVRHLMATVSYVRWSLAMNTMPNEPWLRGAMVWYRPSRTTPSANNTRRQTKAGAVVVLDKTESCRELGVGRRSIKSRRLRVFGGDTVAKRIQAPGSRSQSIDGDDEMELRRLTLAKGCVQ